MSVDLCTNCGFGLFSDGECTDAGCREQKRAFVRAAAIAYFAALPDSAEVTLPDVFHDVWRDARALWAAKPRDC